MKKIFLLLIMVLYSCSPVIYRVNYSRLKELEVKAVNEVKRRLSLGLPSRLNGFSYAIDLAEIMQTGAEIGDSTMFNTAYEILKKHYIIRDSWIDSSILWRYKPGVEPDASGTAETIHCAHAIFLAYKKWKKEEYKRASYSLAKAYLKHGYMIDSNRFIVKNYFNYQTRTLSENTYLINQRPDFLYEIGFENNDSEMLNKAKLMYNAIIGGYVSNGFFYSIYDPGILTIDPASSGYFSPNSIFPLISSIDIAISIKGFNEKPAREILKFFEDNFGDWNDYYIYNSGGFIGQEKTNSVSLVVASAMIDLYFALGKPKTYKNLIVYLSQVLADKVSVFLSDLSPENLDSYYFELARAIRTMRKINENGI